MSALEGLSHYVVSDEEDDADRDVEDRGQHSASPSQEDGAGAADGASRVHATDSLADLGAYSGSSDSSPVDQAGMSMEVDVPPSSTVEEGTGVTEDSDSRMDEPMALSLGEEAQEPDEPDASHALPLEPDFHLPMVSKLDECLPPCTTVADPVIQELIRKQVEKQNRGGRTLTQRVMEAPNFQNPVFLEQLTKNLKVDEFGTNYPKELWQPDCNPEDTFKALEAREKMLREKREEEKRNRTQVEFVHGGSSSSSTIHPPGGRLQPGFRPGLPVPHLPHPVMAPAPVSNSALADAMRRAQAIRLQRGAPQPGVLRPSS